MPLVNNVTRMLDARGVEYVAYELPEDKLGAREAAQILGVPAEQVFKTIVVERGAAKGPLLVLVPGNAVVDLKRVALAVGEKKVHLPTEREAEHLTGLRAGGISPLVLMNKGFRVLIDASAETHGAIFVSGGQRGLNIRIRPGELAKLTNARFVRIAAPEAVEH